MCGGSGTSNLLKAVALGALGLAACASATAPPGPKNVAASSSCVASSAAAASPRSASSNNRWVSRALAARGGADEPEKEAPEGIPGVMSEVQIALSSFNDIVGENLLVVDNAKKGTTKEVRRIGDRGV